MKIVNKICQVSAVLFGLATLVLFFTSFATIVSETGTYSISGTILAFGGKLTAAGVKMAKSTDLLFCFCLTVLAVVCGAYTFKSKGARYASPAFSLIAAVYMLVITLSAPSLFIDTRPLSVPGAEYVTYGLSVLLATISLFLCLISGVAHLLIDDYIICSSSKNKLTIPKRIVRFFRDYKSETKKIVWPGIKDVVKNTAIVLIMCLFVGVFIWLIDLGLAKLLEIVLGL